MRAVTLSTALWSCVMRRPRTVIRAYQTLEWSEIAVLAALTAVLILVVEGAFLTAGTWPGLTASAPFVAGALAFKHYEYEPLANRMSASLVGAVLGIAIQVLVALVVTT